jgi:ADP-ribose pyrophosphatase
VNEPPAVVDSELLFRGKVITLHRDTVRLPDGSLVEREIVDHLGAVAVAAVDDDDRIVLVNQYRAPVGARLDELPAGLLDVDGEPPLESARRELAEEASLQASEWHVLLDLHTSPGFSDEFVRVYLARGLSEAPHPEGFVLEHEEVDMTVARVPLDDALARVLAGEITNAAAVAGIAATALARHRGWRGLRPAELAWPDRSR